MTEPVDIKLRCDACGSVGVLPKLPRNLPFGWCWVDGKYEDQADDEITNFYTFCKTCALCAYAYGLEAGISEPIIKTWEEDWREADQSREP